MISALKGAVGIIQSINVAKGDTVETGNALVTIE